MRYRELLEACWKGYHKEGMKTMFGKRYPNCVKNKKTNEEQGVAEGLFDIDSKIKGRIMNITGQLSDIPGNWNHEAQEFTDRGMEELKSALNNNAQYIRYALNLTTADYDADLSEGARVARKPGQPAGSKKHSDLYTDENPKGTITGLKFATAADARASVTKIRSSGRSHAHKIQAAVAMEQRARAAGKSDAAAVYRRYIDANKKTNEQLMYESADCVNLSEAELEEDLKKWFKQKWVRFGPDGKVRGSCGGRSSGEGKPKCLPASKAQALGKKGRASSAAKKRREDPDPERRGAAKNVATRTRSMKEQGYQEHEPPQDQQQPSSLRKGLDVLGNIFTAGKLLQDPKALADQEIKNYLDPSRQNQSIIRRMFPKDKNQ